MSEIPDFQTLRDVARNCGACFPWAVGERVEMDGGQYHCSSIGPQWDDYDPNEPPDYVEDTIAQCYTTEYDDEKIARYIATFDPPTVLDLIERAALNDENLYEFVGIVDGGPVYRRKVEPEVGPVIYWP